MFEFFQKLFSNNSQQLNICYQEKEILQKEKNKSEQELINLQQNVVVKDLEIVQFNNKINSLVEENVTLKKQLKNGKNDLEKLWENKYPRAKIVYKGRSLPFSTEMVSVPVNTLITPTDPFIIYDLKQWGLYQTGEDYETFIPKIYTKIKEQYYKYKFDQEVWGKSEVWEFPFELRAKGFKEGFDCDSWAVFQASYYIAAGVPSWVVRCVAGDTSLGGHCTVYVLSSKDNKWHHLNSTYGTYLYEKVKDYPTHDHAREGRDKIGITTVWFSFTDKSGYYSFGNESASKLEDFEITKEDKNGTRKSGKSKI